MELVWIIFIHYAAISFASYIDSGYDKATRGSVHNRLPLPTNEITSTVAKSIREKKGLSFSRDHSSKHLDNAISYSKAIETDSELPATELQRRGKDEKKPSKKKKQSGGNRPVPQLQHQRSGSSFHSNSPSANSLGVEDKGVSKPIPKRHSDRQLRSDVSSEYLGSLGVKSVGDLRRLDNSLGSGGSGENLFGWIHQHGNFGSAPSTMTHQTRVSGFSPPTQWHQQMPGGGFGSAPGAHNFHPPHPGFASASGFHPSQGQAQLPWQAPGSPTSPVSPRRPNSNASKSESAMSIEHGEEVQGPPRPIQRSAGYGNLMDMDDQIAHIRQRAQRMQIDDRSPGSSMRTSSGRSSELSP